VIDGFHISGCLSMLDGHAVDLDACRDMGIAMFTGEAEGRFDTVLRDAAADQLAATYGFLKNLRGIEAAPAPFLPKQYVVRTIGHNSSFDAGRGCHSDPGLHREMRVADTPRQGEKRYFRLGRRWLRAGGVGMKLFPSVRSGRTIG
jgi:hypothetical protein